MPESAEPMGQQDAYDTLLDEAATLGDQEKAAEVINLEDLDAEIEKIGTELSEHPHVLALDANLIRERLETKERVAKAARKALATAGIARATIMGKGKFLSLENVMSLTTDQAITFCESDEVRDLKMYKAADLENKTENRPTEFEHDIYDATTKVVIKLKQLMDGADDKPSRLAA